MKKTLHNQALYAIVDISKLVTSSRNFFEIKDEIVSKMLEVIPPKKACINIFEQHNHQDAFLVCHETLTYIPNLFKDRITENGIQIPMSSYPAYIRESVETKRSIYIKDLTRDIRATDELKFAEMEGYTGRAVFPFVSGNKVLGFMTCFLAKGEFLSSEDMNFLDSVASFLGMSIEMTRHNGEMDRIINSLRNTIGSISIATDELYKNKDINSFLTMISEQACKFTGSKASFAIIEDKETRINAVANYGDFDDFIPVMRFVVEQKAENPKKKFFVTQNIPPELINRGLRSLVYENLIKDGQDVGSLIVVNSERYNIDDMRILSIYSSQIMLSLVMYLDSRKLFEQQLMERDLEIIARQQELIMSEPHMELADGTTIDYHHTPSKQIGGDFCKVVRLDDKKAIIFIADVMGHGILSNYFVAMMKGILRTLLYENLWPNEILSKMNAILFSDLDTLNLFITARILMLDCENQVVISANAGHPLPLVIQGDGSSAPDFFMKEEGMPLGIMADSEYEQRIYDISKLKLISVYTDGVVESVNKNYEEFATEGLEAYLQQRQDLSGKEICQGIEKELMDYTGTDSMEDDIMLVVIKKQSK